MAEHLDAFDELLSAAWSVIRQYPLERRPRHLAANLLRDCEYHAFTRHRRRKVIHEYTEIPLLDRPVDNADSGVEPLFELLEIIHLASIKQIDAADIELLRVLITHRSVRDVARQLDVTERTVRNHRAAVVHRLRAAIAA